MALTRDIININAFGDNDSASGQRMAEVPREPVIKSGVTSSFSQIF